jgi:hypothetical protein
MKKFSLLGLAVLIMVLLSVGQIAAEPPFIEATQTQYICIVDLSAAKIWEKGNANHGRGRVELTYMVGDEEHQWMNGPNYIDEVNWNVNLKTNRGVSWGTFYHEMTATGGGFRGTWTGTIRNSGVIGPLGMPVWLLDGHAVGQGEGALEGKVIHSWIVQELYDPAVEGHPCDYFDPIPGYPFPMSWVRSTNTVRIIDAN